MSTIGRNMGYNLIGSAIPLVLFAATIPAYIWLIGVDRYGVLAVVWLIFGFSGFLDFGLGRAATQMIAASRDGTAAQRKLVLDSALAANVIVGAVSALIIGGLAWVTFAWAMKLEPWLRAEALEVVGLLFLGVPVITTLGILNGALQGREKFLATNRINVLNSALFQVAPLVIAALAGPRLWPMVLAALLSRATAVFMLWRECRREFGASAMVWRRKEMIEMLGYGGWVAGAGVLGMILIFGDRILIGSLIGPVAITIYALPLDATRRFAIVADSLSNALFPRFSNSADVRKTDLAAIATGGLYLLATPAIVGFIIVADPLFRLWLGEEIGGQSAPLSQILALAAWVNIFAKTPTAMLQAEGRPKVVTCILASQVPLFFLALYFGVSNFGIMGAAWVYLARNTVDTATVAIVVEGRFSVQSPVVPTYVCLLSLVLLLQSNSPLEPLTAILWSLPVVLTSMAIAWFAVPEKVRSIVSGILAIRRRGH